MKFWRQVAASIKTAMIKAGKHERGVRYGRMARVVTAPPQWRGGPIPVKCPSPLLSGLLKRQASL